LFVTSPQVLSAPLPGDSPLTDTLPRLREDLALYRYSDSVSGAPAWNLYDPLRNHYYQIGWPEMEILMRWDAGSAERIIAAVNSETTLDIDGDDISRVAQFLQKHQLIMQDRARIPADTGAGAGTLLDLFNFFLRRYLFFRVPLVHPDRWLEVLAGYTGFLFTRPFLLLVVASGLAGLYLVTRQWDLFVNSWQYLNAGTAVVAIIATILVSKLFHELAHALTAKRHGLSVSTMGVAFLVFWPVLYTDATEAWKLRSRRKRIAISISGIIAETGFSALATFAWSFCPEGEMRGALFVVATTSWISTLAINGNPLLKFDGYHVLVDALNIPNLQERAFSLARWHLRNFLLGLNAPPPEILADGLRITLIIYAYLAWIYRFFVFLAIALIVYLFLFKVAGLVLMTGELYWFIFRPVNQELRTWYTLRRQIRVNARLIGGLAVLAAGITVLLLPVANPVMAPAHIGTEEIVDIYPARPGRLEQIHVSRNDRVDRHDRLFSLESPRLGNELQKTSYDLDIAREKRAQLSTDVQGLDEVLVLEEKISELTVRVRGIREEMALLTHKAPDAGVIRYLADDVSRGVWVNESRKLISILLDRPARGVAFLGESEVQHIASGQGAQFYSENAITGPVEVTITEIEIARTKVLDDPGLASIHGGRLQVGDEGGTSFLLQDSVYKVRFELPESAPALNSVRYGTLRIQGRKQSLLSKAVDSILAVLVRESGF
jgi:putative peptide zinc metalloprotease protein